MKEWSLQPPWYSAAEGVVRSHDWPFVDCTRCGSERDKPSCLRGPAKTADHWPEVTKSLSSPCYLSDLQILCSLKYSLLSGDGVLETPFQKMHSDNVFPGARNERRTSIDRHTCLNNLSCKYSHRSEGTYKGEYSQERIWGNFILFQRVRHADWGTWSQGQRHRCSSDGWLPGRHLSSFFLSVEHREVAHSLLFLHSLWIFLLSDFLCLTLLCLSGHSDQWPSLQYAVLFIDSVDPNFTCYGEQRDNHNWESFLFASPKKLLQRIMRMIIGYKRGSRWTDYSKMSTKEPSQFLQQKWNVLPRSCHWWQGWPWSDPDRGRCSAMLELPAMSGGLSCKLIFTWRD